MQLFYLFKVFITICIIYVHFFQDNKNTFFKTSKVFSQSFQTINDNSYYSRFFPP